MELEKVKTDGKERWKRRDRQRKNPRSIDEAGSMKTRHEIVEASNASIIELQGLHPPKNSVSDQKEPKQHVQDFSEELPSG